MPALNGLTVLIGQWELTGQWELVEPWLGGWLLSAVALGLILIGVGIRRYQRRAATCSLHNQLAGRIAMGLSSITICGGLLILLWIWST